MRIADFVAGRRAAHALTGALAGSGAIITGCSGASSSLQSPVPVAFRRLGLRAEVYLRRSAIAKPCLGQRRGGGMLRKLTPSVAICSH
jgi:hypothetical protein